MKKLSTLLLFIFTTTLIQAQVLLGEGSKLVFASPQLHAQIGQHQRVAILPFEAKITYQKTPKNYSAQVHQEQQSR